MFQDPLPATGAIFANPGTDKEQFLGTCFLYLSDDVAVTAAHCVPQDALPMLVHFPNALDDRRINRLVIRILVNPDGADIALLFFEKTIRSSVGDIALIDPTTEIFDTSLHFSAMGSLGLELQSYGFPDDGPIVGDQPAGPTPRLLTGHLQRGFAFRSGKYNYHALEWSTTAPAGLSGAPLFSRDHGFIMVVGVITGNIESYSIAYSEEEVDDNGRVFRQEARQIISYGLAATLVQLDPWIQSQVDGRDT